MASDTEPMESDLTDGTTPQSSWVSWLTMPLLLLLGWVVYEVTMLPGLAALFMCLKFGWADFRTAFWLRRTDPNKPRGRACFWMYLTSGVWKVAIMGFVMAMLVAILYAVQQKNRPLGQPIQREQSAEQLAIGATLTMLAGFGICSVLTVRTILIGRRYRVRYWLSSGTHRDRVQRNWPPKLGRHNHAATILITGITLGTVVILPMSLAIVFSLADRMNAPVPMNIQGFVYIGSLLLILPLFIMITMDWLRKRMVAEHPIECWGTDPLPDPKPTMAPPAHPDDVWMQS
ncbi:hypothetical protein [Tuwongella immobilis]|uniref:Uncharacterized protein n=1 Tax=Tuwongella immobilis TaxID=692036 RepID=A0A6C2YYK2_9BACT|nr:hypothetical protein [Tuwongella immobilis]VIP05785.1 unnamed protein product [Tuwongella immobilis]VTS08926.1 unnamed protein product [Tuwongella immobilis]